MKAELQSSRINSFSVSELNSVTEHAPGVTFNYKYSYRLPVDEDNFTVLITTKAQTLPISGTELRAELEYDTIFSYSEKPKDMGAFIREFCLRRISDVGNDFFIKLLQAAGFGVRTQE